MKSQVEIETKDLIKKLLPQQCQCNDTALVLANAFSFKGAWDRKLNKSKTEYYTSTFSIYRFFEFLPRPGRHTSDIYKGPLTVVSSPNSYQNGQDTKQSQSHSQLLFTSIENQIINFQKVNDNLQFSLFENLPHYIGFHWGSLAPSSFLLIPAFCFYVVIVYVFVCQIALLPRPNRTITASQCSYQASSYII